MLQSFKNGHMKMFSFLLPSPTLLCVLMQLFSIVDSFFGTNKMLLIGGTGAEVQIGQELERGVHRSVQVSLLY